VCVCVCFVWRGSLVGGEEKESQRDSAGGSFFFLLQWLEVMLWLQ
jgi:hypothetical protein